MAMTATLGRDVVVRSTVGKPAKPTSTLVTTLLVLLRLALAWEFLWAFADKTFGWGFATLSERSWINGGSPTKGFLTNSATGPFESFYKSIAGDTWTDWLFMIGLFGIGAALLFGVGMRIAAATGALLMLMMWSVVLPPATNPFLDTHLIEALLLILLAATYAGDRFGFGRWWGNTRLVRAVPALR
jgi:thiosulfate dehydrogenase (quinone) large subunit